MILFFSNPASNIYAVQTKGKLTQADISKLQWLFSDATHIDQKFIDGEFIGPRKEMITPWSTNAVEITQNMGITGISRIEEFTPVSSPQSTVHEARSTKHEARSFDPMLQALYVNLNQNIFTLNKKADSLIFIDDISEYNKLQGLALNEEEISYLEQLSKRIGRNLSDCEVFGFSQVNSEHCRHKIFNGRFIIDGIEKPYSLFELIKKTSEINKNRLVSAYKDNCAFIKGPVIMQFAPETQDKPDYFVIKDINSVLSIKAETHNFPTTVEPFNGAATGSGGEIRDRMAGGKGGIVLAGTAVYMTSYPTHKFKSQNPKSQFLNPKSQIRKWLYHTPEDILIKASNGASDFGNKFGQPLVCGSLLTFEHFTKYKKYGYDKVIMLAGGLGFAKEEDAFKVQPGKDEDIVVLGGDNYRIGMGGGAVSSVATGEYENAIELNAVQRSNPEMQKRVYNAIRAMAETTDNPIVSIHDHGAGGHLNCLSELVESSGGTIDINKLPIGDATLSAKEIIGNESQERMGLVIKEQDAEMLKRVAERERAPFYVVGKTTGDNKFIIEDNKNHTTPVSLLIKDMLGNPPKTIIVDSTVSELRTPNSELRNEEISYDSSKLKQYLESVLQLEAVACKDWLTNKVDRSVTGKVARQQCAGKIQLPLNDLAVVAIDYNGKYGIATSLGHAPVSGLINPVAGSVLSVAEALTNIIWAPIKDGIKGISLSANWMWPSRNKGEDARLYDAVEALSNFAIELGINIPTGKDSLSMTQKYPDGDVVYSPGTVIITAAGEVTDINKVIDPVIRPDYDSRIFYIDFSSCGFKLGGSSFSQIIGKIGTFAPTVKDAEYFKTAFNAIQQLILENKILSGHDISAGGMLTTLLEMTFAEPGIGLDLDFSDYNKTDLIKILFSENPGIIIQVKDISYVSEFLNKNNIKYQLIGKPINERVLNINKSEFLTTNSELRTPNSELLTLDIDRFRDIWYKTSYLFDRKQCGKALSLKRFNNYKNQMLQFKFNESFTGKLTFPKFQTLEKLYLRTPNSELRTKAAIIREKGVNGDREMAYAIFLAGFDVKDVHMTDLISGRETLEDINFIVFVGGFSNSDVLGSAKGWAGAFLYNEKAKTALDNFYKRPDTLSLGVCNGCQLMVELGLIETAGYKPGWRSFATSAPALGVGCTYVESLHPTPYSLHHNDSHKFESAFLNVDILENNSVMLKSLSNSRLGIWVAHGEGKFSFPYEESKYNIPMKYGYNEYPGNPNGSQYTAAAIVSDDGRHLAMMPHLERAFLPWQWAYYPDNRRSDEITPWLEPFVNALEWIKKTKLLKY